MTLAALPPPLLAAFNHLLAQAPWARERLRPYAGRTARFTLPPLAGAFGIDPEGHVAAPPASCEVADVTIHLPAAAPLLALQGLDVLMRGVRLEGAVDFAESLGFVLKHLRWDAEEDLSRVVGDIAAHRIVGGAQQFVAWQQDAARKLAGNLAEYFTEEDPLIARRDEIAAFVADVGTLRDDIARLEKRVARLAH